jgi:hypothetical protein
MTTQLHLMPRSRISRSKPLIHLHVCMAWAGSNSSYVIVINVFIFKILVEKSSGQLQRQDRSIEENTPYTTLQTKIHAKDKI